MRVSGKNFILLSLLSAVSLGAYTQNTRLRGLADTVGFAHTAQQMDELMLRIGPDFDDKKTGGCRLIISPHDDYTYAAELYTKMISRIKRAKTVLIFGVAHKAKQFGLENRIIFDSFGQWRGPYKNIQISEAREEIISLLPEDSYVIHDSIQAAEHSVEALVPFLQYFNLDVEIISILVPHMSYERMEQVAKPLSEAIEKVMKKRKLKWGKDFAIAISNDAVHYGDEGWNGRNFAFFGTDSAGYKNAVRHEKKIIAETLTGKVQPSKIKAFTEYTVQKDNHREYKWTWCGRYSVPFGLIASYYLQQSTKAAPLKGDLRGYSSSIDHKPLQVKDLGLDVTAPASLRHWVGYVGIAYE